MPFSVLSAWYYLQYWFFIFLVYGSLVMRFSELFQSISFSWSPADLCLLYYNHNSHFYGVPKNKAHGPVTCITRSMRFEITDKTVLLHNRFPLGDSGYFYQLKNDPQRQRQRTFLAVLPILQRALPPFPHRVYRTASD